MRVNVHRNLTWSGGVGFSILDTSFQVIDRELHVILSDALFVVQRAGKARALATGHRNVHAFVRGELEYSGHNIPTDWPTGLVEATYHPFVKGGDSFFTVDDGEPIYAADTVWLTAGRAFVR